MTFLWTDSIWIKGTIKFTPTNKIALIMLCVNLLCVIEQSIPTKIQNSVTPSRLNSATFSTGFLRYYAGYALLIFCHSYCHRLSATFPHNTMTLTNFKDNFIATMYLYLILETYSIYPSSIIDTDIVIYVR